MILGFIRTLAIEKYDKKTETLFDLKNYLRR